MFDTIIKTILTDIIRMALVAFAAWLNANGFKFNGATFVADGLAVFAVVWAWWENKGDADFRALVSRTMPGAKTAAKVIPFLFVVVVLQGHVAHAQSTISTKAPIVSSATCTTSLCQNYIFIGGGIGGVGSNLDIIGSGLDNSVFADGMLPFADAEWMTWNGTFLLGVDVGGGYQFAQGASIGGITNNQSGGMGWAIFEAGGSLSSLLNIPSVSVLGPLQTDLMTLYGGTGPLFEAGATLPALRAGAKYLVGPNLQLDLNYTYANDQSNSTKNVQLVLIGLKYGFQP